MLLFAVDGKTDESALFECSCRHHAAPEPANGVHAGANSCRLLSAGDADQGQGDDRRYDRVMKLIRGVAGSSGGAVRELQTILADPEVEQRGESFGTVYAAIACPALGRVRFTFGGYPAASRGNWHDVPWPWE